MYCTRVPTGPGYSPHVSQTCGHTAWHTLKPFYRTRHLTGPTDRVPLRERHTHAIHTKHGQLTQAMTHTHRSQWSLLCLAVIHTRRHTHQSSKQSSILTPGSACSRSFSRSHTSVIVLSVPVHTLTHDHAYHTPVIQIVF